MELMPDYQSRVVRFSIFEVDLRAGELRRNGVKVKLQNQPFQILAMLLERRGEVLTREELCTRLWSADTFVNFDNGLNSAIRRLRDALGDTAENPTFVETLGRRGYRFIAAVEGSPAKEIRIVPAPEQGKSSSGRSWVATVGQEVAPPRVTGRIALRRAVVHRLAKRSAVARSPAAVAAGAVGA